ncbi:PE-PPE domain-containing protein [Rhodococcus sp. BH5]|nr:cutinase family protein [Rhodococcus sp. BH5]MCZ9635201.1 PE-PPE domain-containing protein [Rhodococcus sp. BH5]
MVCTPIFAVAGPAVGSSGSSNVSSATGPSNQEHPDSNNYADDCPNILIVSVSGATDSTVRRNPMSEPEAKPWSNWLSSITVPTGERNADDPGTVGWVYVPYSSTYGLGLLDPVTTYQDSVTEGVASTNKILDDNKRKCGDRTKYVLLGYSMGAEVVERVSRELGHRDDSALVNPDDLAGVVLIGDPYRPSGAPSLGEPGPSGGGFMSSEPADYGRLTGKVVYSCNPYDMACDAPKNIAVLELALGVLGQMHFTLLNPGQAVSDFAAVIGAMTARSIVYIVTHKDWFDSDESFLDVFLEVSDRSYDPDAPDRDLQLTDEQVLNAITWARGPGSKVVKAKLEAEGAGFAEDNSGVVDLVVKPYIFLGLIEHMAYWTYNPNDPWYSKSERIVDWITELARSEKSVSNSGN